MKRMLEKLMLIGVLVGTLTIGAGAITKNKVVRYIGEGVISSVIATGIATPTYLSRTRNKLYGENNDYSQ